MLTLHHGAPTHCRPAPRRSLVERLAGLAALIAMRRSRRSLADLDDHILRDIGLTRHEARVESERPIWDAPGHWFL